MINISKLSLFVAPNAHDLDDSKLANHLLSLKSRQTKALPAHVVTQSPVVAIASVLAIHPESPLGAGIGTHLSLKPVEKEIKIGNVRPNAVQARLTVHPLGQ